MKKAIIVPNPKKDKDLAVTALVAQKLGSFGISCYAADEYSALSANGVEIYHVPPADADCVIVIGGDGSVIDASGLALALDIPLLGINLGKVGYLGSVDIDNLDSLAALCSGGYRVEEKLLLCASKISADGKALTCTHKAVNDVVISHDDYLGISDFILESGHGDRIKYRADGIIVSTPVGSTAYSLSAGGPVISHAIDSIAVTPICPHSFFNRTIIYAPNEEIIVSNEGDNSLNISVDGRYFSSLSHGEACAVYVSKKKFKMIVFSENNMFSVLFKKIKVLEDQA